MKEEIEELCHLLYDQIAIYNAYSSILRPFIFQIAEEKDPNDIPTWNGTFISQYIPVKRALYGTHNFSTKNDIIALIAKINFNITNYIS